MIIMSKNELIKLLQVFNPGVDLTGIDTERKSIESKVVHVLFSAAGKPQIVTLEYDEDDNLRTYKQQPIKASIGEQSKADTGKVTREQVEAKWKQVWDLSETEAKLGLFTLIMRNDSNITKYWWQK
jgi:hypothetical protein